MRLRRRKETSSDRGYYNKTAYKKVSPSGHLTYRRKANMADIKKEIVNVSQASDHPVTSDEVARVFKHFSSAMLNLLIKYGEVSIPGFGVFWNKFIERRATTHTQFQSIDDDLKKLPYVQEYIKTSVVVNSEIKARLNNRKTNYEKIIEGRRKKREHLIERDRAGLEEEAALAMFHLRANEPVSELMDKYSELIYWNDFSCYHTVKGSKKRSLPVRPSEVERRLNEIIADYNGGDRYISVWDEYMTIAAFKARRVNYNPNLWVPHNWSYQNYLKWAIKKKGG